MIATLSLLVAAFGGSPSEASADVHARGGYPSEIVLAPAPRWTQTHAPTRSDGIGDSGDRVPVPQEGGGEFGEEDEGWEGDPWLIPDPGTPLEQPEPPGVPWEPGVPADGPAVPWGQAQAFEGVPSDVPPDDPAEGWGGGVRPGTPTNPPDPDPSTAPPVPVPEPNPSTAPPVRPPVPVPVPDPAPEPEPEPEPEPAVEPTNVQPDPTPAPERDAPPDPSPPLPAPEPAPTPSPSAPPTTPVSEDHSIWWWVLLGVGALALLWKVLPRLRGKPRRPVAPRDPSPLQKASAPRDEITLTELDYDAEIRAMLRLGLRAVGWQPHGTRVSWTAREVSRSVPRSDPRAAPLHDLVAIAERVRFAGKLATHDDYQSALEALHAVQSAARLQTQEHGRSA